jgi:hypothetical protein
VTVVERRAGLNFTQRKNGEVLATLRIPVEISRETLAKIAARRNCSETEALRLIRAAYDDLLGNIEPTWEDDGEIVIA